MQGREGRRRGVPKVVCLDVVGVGGRQARDAESELLSGLGKDSNRENGVE